MMIDIAEEEFNIPIRKKIVIRAVDRYKEEQNETIVSSCILLCVSRQVYYRSKTSEIEKRERANIVVSMVKKVRIDMPKIATHKLYHILHDQLKEVRVGRVKLFAIIKANHLDIKPQRSYCVTTNSHHHLKKHRIKLKVSQ